MMDNEKDVIEMLQGIGYEQIMINENVLNKSIIDGFKNENFRNFIIWITEEIRVLANLEERVHKSDELNEFVLELSAFLKEMICPWQSFVSGPISDRYQTRESRFTLIFYLITELMALQMYHKIKPVEEVIIEIKESPTAAAMKDITTILNMGKPPDNISTKAVFDKMNSRLTEVIQKSGSYNLRKPLFAPKKKLTVEQWDLLKKHQQDLDYEYNMRRKMLLTRLDVTIQSFQWSDKLKGKKDAISATYTKKRQTLDSLLTDDKATDIPALLAARDDLAIIEKTSGVNVRKNTNAKIQKHVIGQVPDRGGRAFEHAPPPPEMPSWQQNRNTGGGGGHGGSGRGDMGGGNRGGGGTYRGGGRGRGGGGGGRGTGRGGSDFSQQNNRGGYQQQQGGGYQRQFSSGSGTGYQHQQNSDGYQQYNNFSGSGYQQQSSNDGFHQQQQFSSGGGYQQSGQTYDNRGGGSRVQGSWSQQSGNGSGGYQQQQQGYQSGRGRSNYNRGGGGGLRRY